MCDLNPGQIFELHLITYLVINISAVTKSTECNFFKLYGRYVSLYTYTVSVLQTLHLLIMQFTVARGTTPSVSFFT